MFVFFFFTSSAITEASALPGSFLASSTSILEKEKKENSPKCSCFCRAYMYNAPMRMATCRTMLSSNSLQKMKFRDLYMGEHKHQKRHYEVIK